MSSSMAEAMHLQIAEERRRGCSGTLSFVSAVCTNDTVRMSMEGGWLS